jgi:hypothetical protein
LYSHFRVHKLKFEFLDSQTGAAEKGFAAYYQGLQGGTPTTLAQCAEVDHFAMAMPGQVMPAKLEINRRDLEGSQPWYDCGNTNEPRIGTVVIGTYATASGLATADVLQVIIHYDLEFKGRTEPTIEFGAPQPVLVRHPNEAHFSCNKAGCTSCSRRASACTTPRG